MGAGVQWDPVAAWEQMGRDCESGAAWRRGAGRGGVPGRRDAVGQEHGGEKRYGFRVAGALTCGRWRSPAGTADDHTKQAAGGKGTLAICPTGTKEGDREWSEASGS